MAIAFVWALSAVLTATNVLPEGSLGRTDVHADVSLIQNVKKDLLIDHIRLSLMLRGFICPIHSNGTLALTSIWDYSSDLWHQLSHQW